MVENKGLLGLSGPFQAGLSWLFATSPHDVKQYFGIPER